MSWLENDGKTVNSGAFKGFDAGTGVPPGGAPPPPPPLPVVNEPSPHQASIAANVGVAFSVIALIAIIAFIAWYFSEAHDHVNTSSVKNIISNSTDTDAHLKTLTVYDGTTLGENDNDLLLVKASVDTNLVPYGDKKKDLGSDGRSWDDLWVDEINGVSVVNPNSDSLWVDGAVGYKKQVKVQYIEPGYSGSTQNDVLIPAAESGYVYRMKKDLDGGASYNTNFYLPSASGSGNFYEFIMEDDFRLTAGHENHIWWNTASGSSDRFRGTVMLARSGDEGDVDFNTPTTYSSFSDGRTNTLRIDHVVPIQSTTVGGAYAGTKLTFTDYATNLWNVEATIIVDSTAVEGDYGTPFEFVG